MTIPEQQHDGPTLSRFNTTQWSRFILVAGLALMTIVVYWQVFYSDFVNFDDLIYVAENDYVNTGLNWPNIHWAFTPGRVAYWHPLTWLSHMLDCELYGLHPGLHHITNLIIHIANVLLVFAILRRLTGAAWKAWFVAAVFAVHPLNVDSVAWIAERKNILSTFFWLLVILSYSEYAKRGGLGWYLVTLFLFVLGLMAKPMLIVLPFVMILLDYWPLGRLKLGAASETQGREGINRLVLEKVPFFILSGIFVYISSLSLRRLGIIVSTDRVPMKIRVANALVSYVKYVEKVFWPRGLAVYYPFPKSVPMWQSIGALLLLVLTSFVLIWVLRKRRYSTVGWLWYLGTLVPVIGLAQAGLWPAMADRWAYVPLLGIFIIIAWGAGDLAVRYNLRKFIPALGMAWLAVLMVCSRVQVGYWQDGYTLFTRALEVTEKNSVAHLNLANTLLKKKKVDEAITAYKRIIELYGDSVDVYYNLAWAFQSLGNLDEAVSYYRKALQIKPNDVRTHIGLGTALAELDNLDKAVNHYRKAIEIDPYYTKAYENMCTALQLQGKFEEATEYYHKALERNPNLAKVHYNLGVVLINMNRIDTAIDEFRATLRLDPTHHEAHNNLGVALSKKNRNDEAIKEFHKALRIKPDWSEARNNLNKLILRKKLNETVEQYTQMLRRNPDDPNVLHRLARVLYQQGKIEQAIKHWTEAARLKPGWPEVHNNLATAFYRKGDARQAVKHWTEAVAYKPDWAETHNNLAWILATTEDEEVRNTAEAVRFAERACQLTNYKRPAMLDTLSVAYAAEDRFIEAIETAEKAIELAQTAEQEKIARDIRNHLELYKANKKVKQNR
jgi:tetratricopeptide (TPR) repeat protein